MFAVYAKEANVDDPLASVVVGERPEPIVQEGWVRVKVTHASLNRHDIFTLRGMTSQEQPIPFPMILGNDAAGVLEDGTPVVLYPVLGSDDWKGDETLDPHWHVISELVPGTMADYVAVPKRNAVPIPDGLSPLHASLLGTAWLTAYRSLFTKSRLIPGQTLLVQGASGGMSTALIQMGRAAGFEVWVTTRNDEGAAIAERLGAVLPASKCGSPHAMMKGPPLPNALAPTGYCDMARPCHAALTQSSTTSARRHGQIA
ncbi:MDR/zinc-dependent alcohol dehydrogenase-like family protein [Xanthomonas euvesicatoria]|uniref:MDR/zinc-dependent alcohol dehydrogenase-like family protein n=1 Tax=Xanthomonas euvesicatoria TaxID=456327 RepID=UPI001F49616C|nr:medium chain dehydrogenase/reductase family protein [Xanthomonas euvesicatoria]